VFFDTFRRVNLNLGSAIADHGRQLVGGRNFDIVPGAASGSNVSFRVHSSDPSAQMPRIARSVSHNEAVAILDDWIDNVVDGRYEGSGCQP
jgi:hypothetical protein